MGGDIVGRDKIVGAPSAAELDAALRPLIEAIKNAPPETQAEAEAKLTELKQEAAKGKAADDGVMAKIVDGLVPCAVGGHRRSAFASPILGGIAGPVTRFVLEKLGAK